MTSIEMISPIKEVKTTDSDPFNDDQGFKTINELEGAKNSTFQPDWNIEYLITGDTFYLIQR